MKNLSRLPRKRTLLVVRGALAVAAGGLAVATFSGVPPVAVVALLGSFVISVLALSLAPAAAFRTGRQDLAIVLIDTMLLVAILYEVAGPSEGIFVSFFSVVLLAAAAGSFPRAVGSATVATFLYAWISRQGGMDVLGGEFLLRIPFFYVAAIYYGYFAGLTAERHGDELKTREERDQLRAVLDVLESTTSSLDIHRVLFEVTSRIARHLGSNRCSVLMMDGDRSPGKAFVLASSDDPLIHMLQIDLDRYPEVRRAVQSRKPVILENTMEEEMLQEYRDQLRHLGFRSLMVIPMYHADEVVGSLVLRAASASAFSKEQVRFARIVAGASTNAIKNALLYQEARTRADKQKRAVEQMERILAASPDLILTTDLQGQITAFSEGGRRMLGFEPRETVGRPVADLFHRKKDFSSLWTKCVHGAGTGQTSVTLRTADGRLREVSLSYSPLLDAGSEADGLVALGRDMTEMAQARDRLLHAYRLGSMGDVLSGAAHELNNPLSAVVGYSQLLMTERALTGQDLRMVRSIHDSAWRCQRIVHNLLSIGRKHRARKEAGDVNDILENVIELKAYQLAADGITVDMELDPDIPRTLLDRNQMQQVFVNLLNNAHTALLENIHGRRLVIRTRAEVGSIHVEIVDNGPGMGPEVLERIFEPFFTTKGAADGTGLGLSVSQDIVQGHGGRIRASSSPGLGAVLSVVLPIVECDEQTAGEAAATTLPSVEIEPGKQILVVDDDPPILDLFLDILGRLPVQVDTARDGSEARRKVLDGNYDLVICDLKMPEMDGQAFYREMLRQRPEMIRRLVFTTGDVAGAASNEFLESTRLPVIRKPIDVREVEDLLRPSGRRN